VISGYNEKDLENSDSGILLNSMGIQPCHEEVQKISPWRFSAAISPDMAAQRENRHIDFEELLQFCRNISAQKTAHKNMSFSLKGSAELWSLWMKNTR